jgi:hypothetical protein
VGPQHGELLATLITHGDLRQALWHSAGLVRYELGELGEGMPHLRPRDDEPLE